jgi:hypothetical protein
MYKKDTKCGSLLDSIPFLFLWYLCKMQMLNKTVHLYNTTRSGHDNLKLFGKNIINKIQHVSGGL